MQEMNPKVTEVSATLSTDGRRKILGPCINMGQSNAGGGGRKGIVDKGIRQPMVHRVQAVQDP